MAQIPQSTQVYGKSYVVPHVRLFVGQWDYLHGDNHMVVAGCPHYYRTERMPWLFKKLMDNESFQHEAIRLCVHEFVEWVENRRPSDLSQSDTTTVWWTDDRRFDALSEMETLQEDLYIAFLTNKAVGDTYFLNQWKNATNYRGYGDYLIEQVGIAEQKRIAAFEALPEQRVKRAVTLREKMKVYSDDAINALGKIVSSPHPKDAAIVAAAKSIIEDAHGKTKTYLMTEHADAFRLNRADGMSYIINELTAGRLSGEDAKLLSELFEKRDEATKLDDLEAQLNELRNSFLSGADVDGIAA